MKKAIVSVLLACSTISTSAGLVDWFNGVKLGESFPKLNNWHTQYASKGLVAIGVSPESLEVVTPFANRVPMQYAVAVEGKKSIQ